MKFFFTMAQRLPVFLIAATSIPPFTRFICFLTTFTA